MEFIYINGRFLTQTTTGVQRYALELIRALDCYIGQYGTDRFKFVLLIPGENLISCPEFKVIQLKFTGLKINTHVWEQLLLPLLTFRKPLINLAGTAPLLKKNQITTFHDAAIWDVPEAYSRFFVMWYKFLFYVQSRVSIRVLSVSFFSRRRLAKRLKISESKIDVVYNTSDYIDHFDRDDSVLSRFSLKKSSFILCVANLNPSKNLDGLVTAFMSVRGSDDIQLVLVGSGNKSIFADKSTHTQQKIFKNVIFTGRVSDCQLKSLYLNAKFFVLPSFYEGFGIPVIEAMACSCPVLCSNTASLPEVGGDAVGYFDPNSHNSIRDALQKGINDNEWLEDLVSKGRLRVLNFSAYTNAKNLFDIITKSFL